LATKATTKTDKEQGTYTAKRELVGTTPQQR
jgi:hypothetical protein